MQTKHLHTDLADIAPSSAPDMPTIMKPTFLEPTFSNPSRALSLSRAYSSPSACSGKSQRNGGHQSARGPWLRLIADVLKLAGPKAELLRHTEKAWSSATFTGSRHTIVLAFEGVDAVAQGEDYIAALPEHEFTISGQLVADALIVSVDHLTTPTLRLTVKSELLLLADC